MNKDILERGLIGVLLLIALCQPVTAQQVADPGLDELRISLTPMNEKWVLDPAFGSTLTTYTLSFSDNTENLILSLEASADTARIEISDGMVTSTATGSTDTTIPLSAVQAAAIVIKVTVGQSSISYNFAANRVNLSQCLNSISDTDNDGYPGVLDIDKDGDGLIEICDLEGLDAMRYQLDGTGYQASTTATEITAGCPDSGCRGYELTRDLDFNSTASYASVANQRKWAKPDNSADRSDIGWFPIGTSENNDRFSFTGVFDGNGHKISNLFMKRTLDRMGLFGSLNESGVLRNIGLDVDIERGRIMFNMRKRLNRQGLGGLVGYVNFSDTLITNSYTEGTITFDNGFNVGGLVGRNGPLLQEAIGGKISNSYSAVNITVLANNLPPRITRIRQIGGLVGFNKGMINNTYASGNIESRINKVRRVGGLVGFNRGTVSNTYARVGMEGILAAGGNGGLVGNGNNASAISGSYWDSTVNPLAGPLFNDNESIRMYSTSTEVLQSLTDPGSISTEIYYNWSTDNWYFGTSSQYPILGYGIGPDGIGPDGIGPDGIGPDEIGPDGNDPACDNDLTDEKFTDRPPCLRTTVNLVDIDMEALRSALLGESNFDLPNNFKIHIRVFPEGLIGDN